MLSVEMRHGGRVVRRPGWKPARRVFLVGGKCGEGRLAGRQSGCQGHQAEPERGVDQLCRVRPPSPPKAAATRFSTLPRHLERTPASRSFYFILYKICGLARMHSSMADSRSKPEATFRHRGKQEAASRRPGDVKRPRDGERAYGPNCQHWQLTLSECEETR